MKRLLFKLTLILTLTIIGVLGFYSTTNAAEKKSKPKSETSVKTETLKDYVSNLPKKYTNSEIDRNITKLPKNYYGNDINYIYDSVYLKYMVKSEYETTPNYVDKVRNNRTMWENKIFPIMYEDYKWKTKPSYLEYDPERGIINVKIDSNPFRSDEFDSYKNNNSKNKYAKEQELYQKTYFISFFNWDDIINIKHYDKYTNNGKLKLSFKVEPDIAKNVYNNIRVLYICGFPSVDEIFTAANNLSKNMGYSRRLDTPELMAQGIFKKDDSSMIVFVKLLEIWAYNIDTGEIIYKEKYLQ